MKIDLHCHSKFSQDTYLEPEAIIDQAVMLGLQGVCFTEHNSFLASEPVEKIKAPPGFRIFRGVEISTTAGHLLAYGLQDDSWNTWSRINHLDTREVIYKVHALGGICIPAHPFRRWESFGENILAFDGIDALETHNGSNSDEENERAIEFALRRNYHQIGGSDCHERYQVGRAYTVFSHPVSSIAELIQEIKMGNCRGEIVNIARSPLIGIDKHRKTS